MKEATAAAALRVQEALGPDYRVLEFEAPTRSAAEAAAAIGCDVAQIAKSLVFRGGATGRAVLIVASGANRVDEGKVKALLGEPIGRADPDFVREATGFAIGGVAPTAHPKPIFTLIDEDLFRFDAIWAAAGTPNAVFKLTPRQLQELTGGQIVKIA